MAYRKKESFAINDELIDKNLKSLHRIASLNKDLYDQGQMWSENGMELEDAPDELKNNFNFVDGFKRGERLKYIKKLLEEKSKLEHVSNDNNSRKCR